MYACENDRIVANEMISHFIKCLDRVIHHWSFILNFIVLLFSVRLCSCNYSTHCAYYVEMSNDVWKRVIIFFIITEGQYRHCLVNHSLVCFCSGTSDLNRRFYICQKWDGCGGDAGWLMVADKPATHSVCGSVWENGTEPFILFSEGTVLSTFGE